MKRYSAKLLFQFRVEIDNQANKMRICEERIITFEAEGSEQAYHIADIKGRKGTYSYLNDEGSRVRFQFIGILDLLCLENICEDGEVWYEIKRRLMPAENKAKLIPKRSQLIKDA